jgi:head-tail adaptor
MYGKVGTAPETLDPGQLRHQITWQQRNISQNSFGEDVVTWSNFLTCRAAVETTSGKGEYAAVMQKWAEAQFAITQHFAPGLLAEMRIAWYVDGAMVYLDVLSIDDPAGTGRYQKIIARTFEGTFSA